MTSRGRLAVFADLPFGRRPMPHVIWFSRWVRLADPCSITCEELEESLAEELCARGGPGSPSIGEFRSAKADGLRFRIAAPEEELDAADRGLLEPPPDDTLEDWTPRRSGLLPLPPSLDEHIFRGGALFGPP